MSEIMAETLTLEVSEETGKPIFKDFMQKCNEEYTGRKNIYTGHPTNDIEIEIFLTKM